MPRSSNRDGAGPLRAGEGDHAAPKGLRAVRMGANPSLLKHRLPKTMKRIECCFNPLCSRVKYLDFDLVGILFSVFTNDRQLEVFTLETVDHQDDPAYKPYKPYQV
jgi:hypothetical protein